MELTNGVITLTPVTHAEFPGFAELKLLYLRAFTSDERRDVNDLIALLETQDFSLQMIQMYDKPAGLINLWKFPHFLFIEHIAITEQFRNRKIGETAITLIAESQDLPIVLETQYAAEDASESRVAFYQRLGFDIIDDNYEQPAYSSEKNSAKMLLLSNRAIMPDPIEEIVQQIHKTVYKKLA